MKILKIFNEEKVPQAEIDLMKHRKAVRGIIFDSDNLVATVFARNNNYYELPGGGVEEGKSLKEALVRECREEAGCDVEILAEVGRTIEVMKQKELLNESFCYIVKVVGEKGELFLAEDEIEEGMEIMWLPIGETIRLIKAYNTSNNIYAKYMAGRDLVFLEEAQEWQKNN